MTELIDTLKNQSTVPSEFIRKLEGNKQYTQGNERGKKLGEDFLNDFLFQEKTSDVSSSLSIVGKRVVRNYTSEFILPDDTRVSITREERTEPAENLQTVTLFLSIGLCMNEEQLLKATTTTATTNDDASGQDTDSGAVTNMSMNSSDETTSELSNDLDGDTDSPIHSGKIKKERNVRSKKIKQSSKYAKCPNGLRLSDYMYDDPWAISILRCDCSSNEDLLRQLEVGCRLEPESYRMERLEKKRNLETIIDMQHRPLIRSIELGRADSDNDSINTTLTAVENDIAE